MERALAAHGLAARARRRRRSSTCGACWRSSTRAQGSVRQLTVLFERARSSAPHAIDRRDEGARRSRRSSALRDELVAARGARDARPRSRRRGHGGRLAFADRLPRCRPMRRAARAYVLLLAALGARRCSRWRARHRAGAGAATSPIGGRAAPAARAGRAAGRAGADRARGRLGAAQRRRLPRCGSARAAGAWRRALLRAARRRPRRRSPERGARAARRRGLRALRPDAPRAGAPASTRACRRPTCAPPSRRLRGWRMIRSTSWRPPASGSSTRSSARSSASATRSS